MSEIDYSNIKWPWPKMVKIGDGKTIKYQPLIGFGSCMTCSLSNRKQNIYTIHLKENGSRRYATFLGWYCKRHLTKRLFELV